MFENRRFIITSGPSNTNSMAMFSVSHRLRYGLVINTSYNTKKNPDTPGVGLC